MFEFEHQGRNIQIKADECFEPNLTTKIILSAVIKILSEEAAKDIRHVIELGCGCGVISTYLMKYGFFKNISYVGMSDISSVAVETTKVNIKNHKNSQDIDFFEFKIGPGLKIWRDIEFDLVINDISAISDRLISMTSWFDNAPNNSGVDGIENTINILREFNELMKQNSIMLIPVLSLSNVNEIKKEIKKLGLNYEIVIKKNWPLPKKMVEDNYEELLILRELGNINFIEKFSQYVVETAVYKIWKG